MFGRFADSFRGKRLEFASLARQSRHDLEESARTCCAAACSSLRWRESPTARSAAARRFGAGARRLRDGLVPARAARVAQDRGCGWTTPASRARSPCRSPAPTRRARRRRALQRRPGRGDHRHQHGLPGEEGVQRRCRFGAARGRSAGGAHPRGGGRGGRRAGDAEDPHRPGPSGATRCASPASPRRRASGCSPSMAAPAPACSRGRPNTTPSPR